MSTVRGAPIVAQSGTGARPWQVEFHQHCIQSAVQALQATGRY